MESSVCDTGNRQRNEEGRCHPCCRACVSRSSAPQSKMMPRTPVQPGRWRELHKSPVLVLQLGHRLVPLRQPGRRARRPRRSKP